MSTYQGFQPGPASEIMQARILEQRSGKPAPVAAPEMASNVRVDAHPHLGDVAVYVEGGKVLFAYKSATVCGEHVDQFSFAYEALGRVWHSVVRIASRDTGAINPKNVSVAGPAQEVCEANR